MDPIISAAISALAIASSLSITFILKKLNISTRLQEIQKANNELNKEYFKALSKKDMKKLDELEPKLKESQKSTFEILVLQMKSMAILLPFALVVPGLVQSAFSSFMITLPFQLPIPFRPTFFEISWRDTFGAYGWFWLSFVLLGGFTQLVLGQLNKSKASLNESKK